LPLIWAFQNSSAADRKKLARLLAKPKRKAGDFKTALAFILRHGGLDYALAKACSHAARAKSQLQIFPDSPPKQALLDLADFVVARSV
jgi:octaprenyl-diphosphate synthase